MPLPPNRAAKKPFNTDRLINIWSFLGLFCLCYFIESITFTYVVTSVQSVERQFQIPSKISGTLVSAGDIGYILTVVLLAYLGSKGNRTRWIGGGLILIAVACFIIVLPQAIFPSEPEMTTQEEVLFSNVTLSDLRKMKALMDRNKPTEPSFVDSLFNFFGFGGGSSTGKKSTLAPEYVQNFTGNNKQKRFLGPAWKTFLPPKIREGLSRYAGGMLGYCNPLGNMLKARLQELKCQMFETNKIALGIIFVGIMLIGVGHSMPWSLGVPLIDDYVKKRNTPLYFGGIFFIRILGPVLGFVLGGAFNQFYLNLKTPPNGLSPRDSRWIGAWWLGYVVVAVTLIIPSIILFFFPSAKLAEIQKAKNEKEHSPANETGSDRAGITNGAASSTNSALARNRIPALERSGDKELLKQKHSDQVQPNEKSAVQTKSQTKLLKELSSFSTSMKAVLKSPIYMGCLIGRLFDAFAFKGLFVFLPKYLESHYGLPMFQANILLGVMGVAGFAVGVGAGSIVMKKLKLSGRSAALLIGMCSLLSGLISFSKIGLGCTSVANQVAKTAEAMNYTFTQACNQDCGCEGIGIFPVCTESGEAFYNPCVAGCTNFTLVDKSKFDFYFDQCMCANETRVDRKYCKDDCFIPMVLYFALNVVSGIISGIAVIPGVLVVLRSVPVEHRSIALGFSSFCVNLLSTFPSPIVFGHVIDTACMKWTTTCSGGTGSCEAYDPDKLRFRSHAFNGGLRAIALLFDVWVWYWSKDLVLLEPETSDAKEEGEKLRNDAELEGQESLEFNV